ncbi:MAG: glycosyltransferase family 39 protein [Nodosilinea sp.]
MQNLQLLQRVRLVAIVLLILAVVLRFAHLDRKVYWHDEAYTSLVITARPGEYFSDELFQHRLVSPDDVLAYQRFSPDLSLTDMLVRKGTQDAQHPPIYYLLLRFWAQLWGTTPAVTRGFSALLSLLIFPAVYWLCLELFESRLSGWVAIALFAVSPFHLVYGQEAREFGFWTVLALVSSALLLRAMRWSTWRSWVWYGLSMVGAFYTGLFSIGIAAGHVAYVLLVDSGNRLRLPWRLGQRTWFCLTTLLAVALLFAPWMYFILAGRTAVGGTTSWSSVSLPLLISMQVTVLNFSRSFFDVNAGLRYPLIYAVALPILALQGYAVYVCRAAPKRVGWFVLTFGGCTALMLGLPDLLFGGQRFTVTRYLIACVVSLELAVVYLLSTYFTATQRWKSRFAMGAFSLLIALGVLSGGVYIKANTWWNKVLSTNYHQVAGVINGSDRPLVIADAYSYYPVSVISLSYLLSPEVRLLLLPPVGDPPSAVELPTEAQTVFLFNLPEGFRQRLGSEYQRDFTLTFQDPWNQIWQSNAPSVL